MFGDGRVWVVTWQWLGHVVVQTTLVWTSRAVTTPLVTGLVWPAPLVSGAVLSCWLVTSAQVQQLRGLERNFALVNLKIDNSCVSGSSCFPSLTWHCHHLILTVSR